MGVETAPGEGDGLVEREHVVQLLNGFITFSAQSLGRGESGGVAWFAHIGGFLAGMLLLFLFRPRQSSRL